MRNPGIPTWALLAGASLVPFGAGAAGPTPDFRSAQAFVRDFYAWYGQEEKKDHGVSLDEFAVKTKPQLFSAEIIQGLKEDEAAQAKVPDEVVGLDFDPFANSQEDCSPFKVGAVNAADAGYRVMVFDSCADSKPATPAVIAAVEKRNGAWVFVDFVYPGQGDLFSVLKGLKEEREKPQR